MMVTFQTIMELYILSLLYRSIIKASLQIIVILMKQLKQKKQPFFVKRIRLRKSVLKTNEILEMISNYDAESIKYSTISDSFKHKDLDFGRTGKIGINKGSIDEADLYNSKSSRFHNANVRDLVRSHKEKKNSEAEMEMGKVGLEVRRIIGDPKHKRSYQCNRESVDNKKKQRLFNLTIGSKLTIDACIEPPSPDNGLVIIRKSIKNLQKCCTVLTPHKKNKVYLYEKMANSEKIINVQQNHVYEKRIRSYTDFLWKCLLSHNVYINLDLELAGNSCRKMKAFVGFGNNGNMIKGLIKRRFWWVISEEMTEDCVFIWTQTKINKIYERQEVAGANRSLYKVRESSEEKEDDIHMALSSSLDKRTKKANDIMKNMLNESIEQMYEFHHKIWNKQDFNYLKQFIKKNEIRLKALQRQGNHSKQTNYRLKTEEVRKKIKPISIIEDFTALEADSFLKGELHSYYKGKPLIHNHLQNNFYLGNKKALFYNLKDYYEKIGQDVFNVVPLTFHIREGFKDPQYHRFTKFYQERARLIKQQSTNRGRSKTRNIWIVKPGENTNQGKGITVIDQIYELNHIIKESMAQEKSSQQIQASEKKTFIVQKYIDRPFLYNDRKFDIRHYLLITNIYGVTRAYWYQEGYIRTSSYFFNVHHFQPEIHLTNDAIQKNYPEYGRYEPYNKISYSEFQNYLNSLTDRKYNFKEEILTKMKKMGKDAARSVYDKISPQNQMHNFQIFGLDFMIDRNFKPWLIEININPCLDCTCPLLDRIIPYMVEQGLKLSLDIVYPPPSHYPNTSKHYAPMINLQTFKYQLIFDSLSQAEELKQLYSKKSNILLSQIGEIQEDQQFKDNGKQIKLQDFT